MTENTPAKKTAARKPAAPKAATPTVDPDRDPRWAALAAPFPADWVEKLPKVLNRNDQNKGRCEDSPRGRGYSADGHFCGGWHSRAVHLDYIGHAGITMRLNDTVGPDNWAWEPMATGPEGLPLIGREFWIKLTVLGVVKYGVGDDYRSSKEAIGDALRNAAMRFGIGTYLWSKSEAAHNLAMGLEPAPQQPAPDAPAPEPEPQAPPAEQPTTERQTGTTPAPKASGPDAAVVQAYVYATQKATDMTALRAVWDQICNANALRSEVTHPETGELMNLETLVNVRKTELEQAQGSAA